MSEKVSFNIASEASYVYILFGGSNYAKIVQFVKLKFRLNSVTRQVNFNWTKNVGKCQRSKFNKFGKF